jgi:hypothetical protein
VKAIKSKKQNLKLQGGSNMTGTDFFKTMIAKHLLATCQSSMYSPSESTHFFQRTGSILMPIFKKGLWLAACLHTNQFRSYLNDLAN